MAGERVRAQSPGNDLSLKAKSGGSWFQATRGAGVASGSLGKQTVKNQTGPTQELPDANEKEDFISDEKNDFTTTG